jgi:hypothetical protein
MSATKPFRRELRDLILDKLRVENRALQFLLVTSRNSSRRREILSSNWAICFFTSSRAANQLNTSTTSERPLVIDES